jgi:hypothetical protein
MKQESKIMFQTKLIDDLTRKGWLVSGSLMGLTVVAALVFFWRLPEQIPLFYSLPYGYSQLADKVYLWLLPTLSFLFWLGLSIIMVWLIEKDVVLVRMLAWFSSLISFLLLAGLVHVLVIIL